jgi:hypothetical protein
MSLRKVPFPEAWPRFGGYFLFILLVLYAQARVNADPDLWGYLAFGRLFWTAGQFPYQDVFSFVPTLNPWVYHEWLTGVVFYPLYRGLGDAGLQVLKYGLGLATVGLIYLTARKRGASPWAAALFLLAIQGLLAPGYGAVRAQVFTYFFFALTLYLLETARLSGRWRGVGLLPLIIIPWGNFHGGFLSGLGLIAFYALGEAVSRRPFWPYAGTFALACLTTLVNPYGVEYWHYLARAVTMARPQITEWASVFRAYQVGVMPANYFLYTWALILFTFFLAWWARWREITPALSLVLVLLLGLKHSRHYVFFLLLAGAYMPLLLTRYLAEWKSRPLLGALSAAGAGKIPALLGAVLAVFLGYRFIMWDPLTLRIPPAPESGMVAETYYPVGAVAYIKERGLSGKLLIHFNWGEYALWSLYPQCRVALDGRFETVYPEEVAREYFDFFYGRAAWRQFLEHYSPEMILMDLKSRVSSLIQEDPQWRQIYADTGSALFRRAENLPEMGR